MKILVASVLVAGATAFLVTRTLVPDETVIPQAMPATSGSDARLAELEREVDALADMLANRASARSPTGEPVQDEESARRLEALERQVAALRERTAHLNTEQERIAARDAAWRTLAAQSAAGGPNINQVAEELFQSDQEAPNTYTEDIISSSFEQMPDQARLLGVECRSRLCKVTYNEAPAEDGQSYGTPTPTDQLISHMSDDLGTDLDIRHGEDTAGNRVLYIEPL